MAKIFSLLRNIFAFDIRALALMRIGTAAIVLLDLSIRATDLTAFYSDDGLLPLHALYQHKWFSYSFSFHAISGHWWIQLWIFGLNALFALLLLIGYRTRINTILCWIFLLSLHNRNPLILQGGDDLLRMTMFWGMFLPWGKKYSVDGLQMHDNENLQVSNFATAGYLLQLLSVYFFAALLKTSPEWRTEGTAIYFALSLDQLVLPLGKEIYHFPELLKLLTKLTWHLELLSPLLFLIPYKNSFFRKIGIFLIASFHIGISLTLFVGLFYVIGIITLIGTIPSTWMNIFEKRSIRIRNFINSCVVHLLASENKILKTHTITLIQRDFRAYTWFSNTAMITVIAYTLIYNWNTTENRMLFEEKIKKMDWIGHLLKINQNWGMFSPSVLKEDGWFIYEAETIYGQTIDINRNGAKIDYKKPENVVSLYANDRWRKYGENLLYTNYAYMRPILAEYLLKDWNKKYPDKLIKSVKVIFMMEYSLPNYNYSEPVKEELAFYLN